MLQAQPPFNQSKVFIIYTPSLNNFDWIKTTNL